MPKREATYKATNGEGNSYTSFNDGSFTYRNKNPETGKTSSTYFDTGKNNNYNIFTIEINFSKISYVYTHPDSIYTN